MHQAKANAMAPSFKGKGLSFCIFEMPTNRSP